MKKVLSQLATSKKFIAFIVGLIMAGLSKKGIVIPAEMQSEIIMLTMAYIGGQGLADLGKEAKK